MPTQESIEWLERKSQQLLASAEQDLKRTTDNLNMARVYSPNCPEYITLLTHTQRVSKMGVRWCKALQSRNWHMQKVCIGIMNAAMQEGMEACAGFAGENVMMEVQLINYCDMCVDTVKTFETITEIVKSRDLWL